MKANTSVLIIPISAHKGINAMCKFRNNKLKNIIEYVVWLLLTIATLCLFKPEYYHKQSISGAIIGLLFYPIVFYVFSGIIALALSFIVVCFSKESNLSSDMVDTLEHIVNKYQYIFLAAAFCAVMFAECKPHITDYQYYVNVYQSSETQKCIVGYVDIESTAEYSGDDNYDYATGIGSKMQVDKYYYITHLYLNDTAYIVENSDSVSKISFKGNHRYRITLDNQQEYFIEFMKRKDIKKNKRDVIS